MSIFVDEDQENTMAAASDLEEVKVENAPVVGVQEQATSRTKVPALVTPPLAEGVRSSNGLVSEVTDDTGAELPTMDTVLGEAPPETNKPNASSGYVGSPDEVGKRINDERDARSIANAKNNLDLPQVVGPAKSAELSGGGVLTRFGKSTVTPTEEDFPSPSGETVLKGSPMTGILDEDNAKHANATLAAQQSENDFALRQARSIMDSGQATVESPVDEPVVAATPRESGGFLGGLKRKFLDHLK